MKPPDPFVARPATLGDAGDVAALMNAFDRAFLEEPDEMDATEVAGWWTGADLERDTLVVRDPTGRLAASGRLKEGEAVVELDAYVHPEVLGRGLGGFLLDWAEEESSPRPRHGTRVPRVPTQPIPNRKALISAATASPPSRTR